MRAVGQRPIQHRMKRTDGTNKSYETHPSDRTTLHGGVSGNRISGTVRASHTVAADLRSFPGCQCSDYVACIDTGSFTQLAMFAGKSIGWCGMASSDSTARSDSLIEEIKGLKGHRLGMPKMMSRQLATERFTEPREAIVLRFLKQTPTQGGLVALGFCACVQTRAS